MRVERPTQADRRAKSRAALLEAAARGISRNGYANLSLEQVAAEAGYTRGALYHQFANKEDLSLAVLEWVGETWYAEVGSLMIAEADPVAALMAMARGHAVYCRRDISRVMMVLWVEFGGRDHPIAQALSAAKDRLVSECAKYITTGRRSGAIPPGPPGRDTASALLAALEAVVIRLAGRPPFDAELAERAVRGVLGLPPTEMGNKR